MLSERHRLIAPDLLGHGDNPATATSVSHDAMADDVELLLKQLDIGTPWHLVGFSLGAAVATVLALRDPLRIATLTLVGTNPLPDSRSRVGAALVRPEAICEDRPRLAATLDATHRSPWQPLAARLAQMWHDGPLVPASLLIPFEPLLLIVGDHDPWIAIDQQLAVLDVCPAARLLVIPGSDHFVLASPPAARTVADAITTMIEESCDDA